MQAVLESTSSRPKLEPLHFHSPDHKKLSHARITRTPIVPAIGWRGAASFAMDHQRWYIGPALYLALSATLALSEDVFNTPPPPLRSNFSCHGRAPGFYADVDANCKVYHTCDDYGNKFTYRCPEETAFRQDALICDHAHLVDCRATTYANIQEPTIKSEESGNDSSFLRLRNSGTSNSPRSFSRSFQVIQKPTKSLSNKAEPGFVFSASVFLRDLDDKKPPENDNSRQTRTELTNNQKEQRNTLTSTIRPLINQFQPKPESLEQLSNIRTEKSSFVSQGRLSGGRSIDFDSRNRNQFSKDTGHRVSFGSGIKNPDLELGLQPSNQETSTYNYETTKDKTRDIFKFTFHNNRDYPYLETLRSIQANGRLASTVRPITSTAAPPASTTELPIHALTLSLSPLVPSGLEDDPYYPLIPTSTEAYYTPSHKDRQRSRTTTQSPWNTVRFELPEVLPDLNTLEDLVDRRKFFYIPRINPG